jgi:hypothetical protein
VIYPRTYGLARHFPNISRWAVDALTPPLKALMPAPERSLEPKK